MKSSDSFSVMQAANFSSDDSRSSRTWKITAHFSPSVHVPIYDSYDSSLQYSQEYIRDYLKSRLQHMQTQQTERTENNMHSITLLSFHILGISELMLRFRS